MQGTPVWRQLPLALLATAVVVVLPALAVAPLSTMAAIPACVLLSLALTHGGAALWRRLPRSRDVIFADLMLWGWVRRARAERRLAHVRSLIVPRAVGPVQAIRDVRALQQVTAMLEERDVYTRRHSLRVTRHSEGIARRLGLSEGEVARVRTAAALHDLGKFFTPREVLNKPGRLTDEEFAIIKRHPADGAALLHGVVEPEVVAMIRHHHERLGGSGYPDGLAGDAIPLGARIIAVADTFDAMTSTRAYRTARPHTKALTVLREEAGVALDADVVAAFVAYYSGRRGTAWSSLASGLLGPVRELAFAGARALPVLGAAAVVSAPAAAVGVASRPHATRTTLHHARAAAAPHPARREHKAGGSPTKAHTRRARSAPRHHVTAPTTSHRPGTPGTPGVTAHPAPTVSDGSAAVATAAPTSAAPQETSAPSAAPTSAPTAAPTAPPAATPAISVPSVSVPGTDIHTPPITIPLPLPPIKLP